MNRHGMHHLPAIATKRDVDEISNAIQANTAAVRELNSKAPQVTTANPENGESPQAKDSNEDLGAKGGSGIEQDRGRDERVPVTAVPAQEPDETLRTLEVNVSQPPSANDGIRSAASPSAEKSTAKAASTPFEGEGPEHLLRTSSSSPETAAPRVAPREPIGPSHPDYSPVIPQLPEINRPLEAFISTAIRNHHTTLRILEQLVSLTSRQQAQIESLARELESVNLRTKYARNFC